jgi:hypothetical protein
MLGLNPDSVRAQLAAQGGGRGGFQRGGAAGASANAGNSGATGNAANTSNTGNAGNTGNQANTRQAGVQAGQGGPGNFNLPEVTDAQCKAVTDSLAKHPEVQQQLGALRERMQNGELDRQAMQAESQKIYAKLKLDPQVARACNFRNRGGGQGGFGGQRAGQAGGSGTPGAGAQSGQAAGQTGGQGGFSGQGGASRGRRGMVFTVKNGKYTPKVVRLGVSNYDVSEVVSGLSEGDSVAILNVAALQARQQADLDQVRNRSGVPGIQRQQPAGGAQGGGAGGAAGAGGARPGGAGQRPGGG